jgi:murein DD-endopeptidase MepM/ murein hydrolase activator NlpD
MAVIPTRLFLLCVAVCCASWLAGCASVSKPGVTTTTDKSVEQRKGVYHKVNKGETLWRIAKTYKISPDDIIQANSIPNAASIEENQLLFIPGAEAVETVILPLTPGGKDGDYAWPVKGRIVSYFDDRKGGHKNPGIDIKSLEGDVVKASREGHVVFADHLSGYGDTIILDHADGFFTVYGHNERILVKLGDYVFRGEKIAQIGDSSRGAFVHFEVRKGDAAKNPLHYLPREM